VCPSELQQLIFDHGSLLNPRRLNALYSIASECAKFSGEFWECGVYRGGSARALAEVLKDSPRPLRLFDTFTGLPEADPSIDLHGLGEFKGEFQASRQLVDSFVKFPFVSVHPGLIPESFHGLEDSHIAFCHVDVDLYRSTRDVIEFVWPRLVLGGVMVFDDYQWPESNDQSCPGTRMAVDEYFAHVSPVFRTEGWPEQAMAVKE